MIHYALVCDKGHAFESWFASSSAFEAQAERGLVGCAVCGSKHVERAVMAPQVARKDRGARGAPPDANEQPVALVSPQEAALRAKLRELRQHLTATADYVGPRFADEARKIHLGETEHRSIYGEASSAEAKALLEDGIEVHPLPPMPDEGH